MTDEQNSTNLEATQELGGPTEAALLPCPFCGGAARFVDLLHTDEYWPKESRFFVQCGNAGCKMMCTTPRLGNPDYVVRIWNARSN